MRLLRIIYLDSPGMNLLTIEVVTLLNQFHLSLFPIFCLDGIEEVWGLESGLILDGLYAGTADCIGIYKGNPAIIDFKTAKKT